MRERVAISGLGCLSSIGFDTDVFRDALICGRSGIRPITTFDTSACRAHLGGCLERFDAAQYIDPAKLRRIDLPGRLAIASCGLALRDSGLNLSSGDEIGIALGTYTAGLHSTVEYLEGLVQGGPTGVPALLFSNTVGNAPASLCAIEFGLRGPNVTLNHREASALAGVAFASGLIRTERATAMVTGGVDVIERVFFTVHDRLRALSPMRRSPAGNVRDEASRPFDRRRNGLVLGEGAFALVMEPWSRAAARAATTYGEVLGIGATASATSLNAWPTSSDELARSMRLALEDAGVEPDQVSAVFASANSTPQLDRVEAVAISEVFDPRPVPVVSLKGALGEFGASGAASLAGALLCLARGVVPPTVGFSDPDPECTVSVTPRPREVEGSMALINSFATGGTNYSVLIQATSRRR
jgi:3-oxoacyl-[acyl-carrier-protein] synthase II